MEKNQQRLIAVITIKWQISEHFFKVDDCWWKGTVINCDEQKESPFLSVHVSWNNNKSELCSPWDLEALDSDTEKIEDGTPLTKEELHSRLYVPTRSEWNGLGRVFECERIAEALESILDLAVGIPMLVQYPVGPQNSDVDYPIDLTMIKARVENHFYRRIDALLSDAFLMYEKIPS
jgi:bromodomain and WD repeat domain-containing protein 1/3